MSFRLLFLKSFPEFIGRLMWESWATRLLSFDEWSEPWVWVSCLGPLMWGSFDHGPVELPTDVPLNSNLNILPITCLTWSSKVSITFNYLVFSSIFVWFYSISRATLLANNVTHWMWLSITNSHFIFFTIWVISKPIPSETLYSRYPPHSWWFQYRKESSTCPHDRNVIKILIYCISTFMYEVLNRTGKTRRRRRRGGRGERKRGPRS